MKTKTLKLVALVCVATPVLAAAQPPSTLTGPGAAEERQLGYGTDGIADEVDDPGLGSVSTFGAAEDTQPRRSD